MIKNFFWDFDGMLFNTYPHTLACFCETYLRHGVVIDKELAWEKFKITMWDAFDYFHTDEAMKKEFYALENDIDFPPVGTPYPFIPEILDYICKNGGKNFLYTHRDRVAYLYFERYNLTRYFTDGVTGDMGFPYKPAPDALLYLTQKYGLSPDECMMLGDRGIDVGSGLNAGMAGLLFDEEQKLTHVKCTYRVTDSKELYELIQTIFPPDEKLATQAAQSNYAVLP